MRADVAKVLTTARLSFVVLSERRIVPSRLPAFSPGLRTRTRCTTGS